MKMKEITVYLSLVAFIQVLLVIFGHRLVSEFLEPTPNRALLFILLAVVITLIIIGTAIYVTVFIGILEKRK